MAYVGYIENPFIAGMKIGSELASERIGRLQSAAQFGAQAALSARAPMYDMAAQLARVAAQGRYNQVTGAWEELGAQFKTPTEKLFLQIFGNQQPLGAKVPQRGYYGGQWGLNLDDFIGSLPPVPPQTK